MSRVALSCSGFGLLLARLLWLSAASCDVSGMIKVELEGFSVYFDTASKATYDKHKVNMDKLFTDTVRAVKFLAPNAAAEVLAILRATNVIFRSEKATEHDDGTGTAWAYNGFQHECASGVRRSGDVGCVEGHKFNDIDGNSNLVSWLSPSNGKSSSLLLHELAHVYYFHLNPMRTSSTVIVAVEDAYTALVKKGEAIKAKHAAPQSDACNVWNHCSQDDYAFSNSGEFHAEFSEALCSEFMGWENDKWPNTRAELIADAGDNVANAIVASWALDAAGLAKAEKQACESREVASCVGCACEQAITSTLGCLVNGSPGPDACKSECQKAYIQVQQPGNCEHAAVAKQIQDTCPSNGSDGSDGSNGSDASNGPASSTVVVVPAALVAGCISLLMAF